MDERVFLRLESGEIVALENGTVPGTSYVVQDGVLTNASPVTQASSLFVEDSSNLQGQTYADVHASTEDGFADRQNTIENIAVDSGETESIVYIVQHEDNNGEELQYTVVGDSDSIGSTVAVQGLDSGHKDAGIRKQVQYSEIIDMQDMSGMETLSRVAAQEFAGSIFSRSSEPGTSHTTKGDNSVQNKQQNVLDKNNAENISICFSCQHCGDLFEDLTSFRIHLKIEHDVSDMEEGSDAENELTLFPTCQLCSQTFVNAKDFEEHKKVHEEEVKPLPAIASEKGLKSFDQPVKKGHFKCMYCVNHFEKKSLMLEHVASEHPDKKLPEENKSSSFSKCPYCHKMYVLRGSNKAMIKHIYMAHPGKSVDVVTSLADKEDMLEEKVNCPFCDLGFYWQKSLIRHMKDTHPKILEETGDDIFAELGIQAIQTPNRRYRRSVVEGEIEGELQCSKCPKRFLWEKSFKRHMVVTHNEQAFRKSQAKKGPVVFRCPHCSLVSKYACAVRKHVERKHAEKVKGIQVSRMELPTMKADAASDIEFKTVDKRPAEERLNFCPIIFRCPFCTYASKQSSNLLRHLTSVKHGNIFSPEELKEIGVTSFKVEQNTYANNDDEEKIDGTLNKRLPKLRLKGKVRQVVLEKFEILKCRKLGDTDIGLNMEEKEDDFSDMDIDNIIDVAEDESEESFDEEDVEIEDLKRTRRSSGRRKFQENKLSDRQSLKGIQKEKEDDSRIQQKDSINEENIPSKTHEKADSVEETSKVDENDMKDMSHLEKTTEDSLRDNEIEKISTSDSTNVEKDSFIEMEIDSEPDSDADEEDNLEISEHTTWRNKRNTKISEFDKQEKENKFTVQEKSSRLKEKQKSQEVSKETPSKNDSNKDKRKKVNEKEISLRNKSKPVDALMCEVCQKEFNNFAAFKEHLPSHVNISVLFQCKECENEIPFLQDMKSHMKTEHSQRRYENDIADVNMKVVKMNFKPVTTYDCPYCEMLFSQSAVLQQHVIMDHTENIVSACIKQEHGNTSRSKVNKTVVSAFNCKYCECFYHNINDIVKHMYIVHKDVERSDVRTDMDSSVRKSGRKRKVPKWLEDSTEDSSPAKKKNNENAGSGKKVLPLGNVTPVGRPKGKLQSKLAEESRVADNSKATTSSESEKEDSINTINNTKQVKRKRNTDTDTFQVVTMSGSDNSDESEVKMTPKRSTARDKKSYKELATPKSYEASPETLDETENKNKCPHCDFVARRSSALTFHINFKHPNVRIKDHGEIKEEEVLKTLEKTSKKVTSTDSPLVSRKNTVIPAEESRVTKNVMETPKKGSRRISTGEEGEQESDDETVERRYGMDNEDEDFNIEFGDSDDDYKPEKDETEDGDSDLDDEVDVSFEDDGTTKGPQIHSCNYCEKKFLILSQLRAHVRTKHGRKLNDAYKKSSGETSHKNSEYYKCIFCNFLSDIKENTLAHSEKQHPSDKVQLDDIRKYKFSTGDIVQNLWKCPYCTTKSKWKQCIYRHISKAHSSIGNEPFEVVSEKHLLKNQNKNKYQCVYCNWQYDTKSDVMAHITESHPDQPSVIEDEIWEVDIADKVENKFQCPYCDLKSNYKRCIERHVSRAHREVTGFTRSDVITLKTKKSIKEGLEGLVYMCPFCDFDSRWKSCIIRHLNTNHPDVTNFNSEAIPCEFRKKSVVNLDEDDELMNSIKEGIDYFKCPYCDAVSETRKGVVKHAGLNHPKKPSINQMQVEKALWDGMDITDKEVVYKCMACDSGSKFKKTVVFHVKKAHPNIKKFHIELLKADFGKKDENLENMYMCKLCNELLMSTRSVSSHGMQVHRNESKIVVDMIPVSENLRNDFKCGYCNHKSGLRKAIVTHVEVCHPEVQNFQAKDVVCEIVRDEQQGTGGYQCPYCDTVNHWKKSITRHIKTVHPGEDYDVEIIFNPAVVHPGGRSSRKSSKQINCLRCGTTYRSMDKMRKHFLLKHPKFAKNYLNKENTEFAYDSFNGRRLDHVCVVCNAKYMWKKSLLVHIKNRHRDIYQVYQTLDHVVDIVADGTDGPRQIGHQDITVKQLEYPVFNKKRDTAFSGKLRCEKCSLVFKTQWVANVHKHLKHRKRLKYRFPCSKCSLSFRTQSMRLQHKVRCHRYQRPGKTLQCTIAGCNFSCKFHKVLQNHYSNIHNLKIPILGNTTFSTYGAEGSARCEICLRTFTSADQLKQHVDLHKKRRPVRFQCGTCGEQFMNSNLRDIHIETFHFDKLEMCDVCGNLFTKANMKKHIKTHDEDQSEYSSCPYCDQNVSDKMFNKHVFNEHQDILNCHCDICSSGDATTDPHVPSCSVCKQSFCQKPMVYVHSRLWHADIPKTRMFSCEACPQHFFTKRMKDAHCHEHHRKKVTNLSSAASVTRSTSTYNTSDPTTHVIHIGQDEGKQFLPKLSESSMNAVIKELVVFEKGIENPYRCLLCNRSFTKSKYIKLHIRRAHVHDEDQPYRCKVCGSGFVRLTEFRKHSRSHSDFRPYKCRYCDKAFKQQANLKDHYRVHTNSKDYVCFICKTEFRQRGGLTSHVVFHDSLKPFKCMFCQKGYTTRGELSRHMQKYNKELTESSEKSYPCHICEENFPHYPMLLKHIDSHNPEKPFQCTACNEKFSNYVSMYFHKVKEDHFNSQEIEEGVKDLEKRGRKFRAKKNSMKTSGPEILYEVGQPISETIYVSQPDAYAESEANIKPVEVIIEEFGQDQVVRVKESEPEHEELLSIAKQLTELSGFAESEFYTPKKNVHQEEDEIIKNMLDADDEVLANLSKPAVGSKVNANERDRSKRVERIEQVDDQRDAEEEDYDYMPEIENDSTTVTVADNEQSRHMMETDDHLSITSKSIPTNMEELVSLVSQNTPVGNNEQVMAYQSEDGSIIYVCLPDEQGMKTEEVIAEGTTEECGVIEDNSEIVIQEAENTQFNMECNETTEYVYREQSNEIVSDENHFGDETATVTTEDQPGDSNAVNIIQIPEIEQRSDTEEIYQTAATSNHTENFVRNDQTSFVEVQQLESSEIQMAEFVESDHSLPVTSDEQILGTNQAENSVVEDIQNQDYTIVEPNPEKTLITIQPRDTSDNVTPESHEDLIRRSQLARHLTGNIEPSTETSRVNIRSYAAEQGFQSITNVGPLVPENITQGLITIASSVSATGSSQTTIAVNQMSVNDSVHFGQVAVTRQGDGFVEGEETLVEYQIDESRFIKEELLDTDYTDMTEKEREVMFFSDNIYTYSQLEKKFICLHCGAKIGTFKNLKNHIRRHAPESSRIHNCTYCHKRFVTKNELKRHLYTHTGERNYECQECGKKFIQPGHLQEHIRVHTGDKPFGCSQCTAAFITKSQLVLHFSRVHSNNEIPCNKCEKVFKTHIDLRRHRGLEHSGPETQTPVVKEEGGDFVCDICGQSFNKKATLKRHLEKHNLDNIDESERVVERFACDKCDLTFKSKYYVKEHVKIVHTQEEDEICELCGMGFNTKSLLRRHRESKHADEDGNRKWFCKICNKLLGSKYAYGYHMGSKH